MSNLTQALQEIEQRKKAIRNNTDLSPEGKRKELEKVQNQEAHFRKSAHDDLSLSWRVMRQKFERLETAKTEAQEQAAKGWDFDRLLYNARAIESEVKQAASLADVRRKYDEVLKSGDKHARRAWAENIFSEASRKFVNANPIELSALQRTANNDLASLTTSPELEAIAKQGSALAEQAVELHKETETIAQHFGGVDWTGQGNEFHSLIEGVKVSASVDPETLAMSHTVVLNP
jgi:hypothetical protein